jgi:nucleoid-associated protein YgaU
MRTASVRRVSAGAVSVTAGRVRAAGVQQVSVRSASLRRVGGPSAPAAGAEPGRLRLTRRGRRVVAVLAMLVAMGVATLIWAAAAGGAQASGRDVPRGSGYGGMTQVVVQPGQTLWSIAAAAEPSANPWTVVQQIIDANALSGARVQAGQLLWVPKG